MKQQNVDQKKGSADRGVSGEKQGMPGGQIGRGDMSMRSDSRGSSGSRSDSGGSEGNSRERKTARNGSDSNES